MRELNVETIIALRFETALVQLIQIALPLSGRATSQDAIFLSHKKAPSCSLDLPRYHVVRFWGTNPVHQHPRQRQR